MKIGIVYLGKEKVFGYIEVYLLAFAKNSDEMKIDLMITGRSVIYGVSVYSDS
jgi:hypothetical protein